MKDFDFCYIPLMKQNKASKQKENRENPSHDMDSLARTFFSDFLEVGDSHLQISWKSVTHISIYNSGNSSLRHVILIPCSGLLI